MWHISDAGTVGAGQEAGKPAPHTTVAVELFAGGGSNG